MGRWNARQHVDKKDDFGTRQFTVEFVPVEFKIIFFRLRFVRLTEVSLAFCCFHEIRCSVLTTSLDEEFLGSGLLFECLNLFYSMQTWFYFTRVCKIDRSWTSLYD